MRRYWPLLFINIALAGCKTSLPASARPALLTNPSKQSLTEIKETISEALGGRQVPISEQVFVNSNHLILQRKETIGPDGLPLQTRVDEIPIIFELFKAGDDCYIKRQGSKENTAHLLKSIECKVR